MKRTLVLSAVLAGLASLCPAATCVSGTLSSYIGLGAGGCTVGSAIFSDFALLAGTTGAEEIAASDVHLMPSATASGPGLTTAVDVTSGGTINETLFNYQISGLNYTSLGITLSGASQGGGGAVTGLSSFCLGGIFSMDGLSGCTGVAGDLATVNGVQNQDSASFDPATFISVINDLTIDGGASGSARGGTLLDRFGTSSTAIPEPMSFLITGAGLVLVAIGRIRLTDSGVLSKGKKS
jgi:hypothetical protein